MFCLSGRAPEKSRLVRRLCLARGVGGGWGVREKYHYYVMDQFSLLQSSSFQDPGSPSLVHNVLYQNIFTDTLNGC
jgi:hypothetical protein